jgi:hypothetical protein
MPYSRDFGMSHGRPNHPTNRRKTAAMRAATNLKPRDLFLAEPIEKAEKQEAQAQYKGEEDWSADQVDRLIHGKRS